jgi:hypothetical protein
MYSHAPPNDVLVKDGTHIRRWSNKIIISYFNTNCAGGKIETNEMSRACGAYGGG